MNKSQYIKAVRLAIEKGKFQTLRKLLNSQEGQKYGVNFSYAFVIPVHKGEEYYVDLDGKKQKAIGIRYHSTPLAHAVFLEMDRHSRIQTIELLLSKGADVNAKCCYYGWEYTFFSPDERVYGAWSMGKLIDLILDEHIRIWYDFYDANMKHLFPIFAPYQGIIPELLE